MLNIYYGGAAADKEQFLFDHIDPEKKTILIVPDQFSLQAERDALQNLGKHALTDLCVVDFSALGHKVVGEIDGHEPEIIDKYGRQLLLSVLIGGMDEDLTVYRGMGEKNSFAEQMNTMISELKRYEISPERLAEVNEQIRTREEEAGRSTRSWLTMKLEDILRIYQAYEEAVSGIYQDSEDYITYYAERIPGSELVRGSTVWIYGFETFTPKNMTVIRAILRTADQVNVILTCEAAGAVPAPVSALTLHEGAGLFDLSRTVMRALQDAAEEAGSECSVQEIEGYPKRSIWDGSSEERVSRIRLVQTSDSFHEAEAAAAHILHLVRDEGYRYGEIAVICNDTEGLGSVLRRTMLRFGIPVFSDHKRSVLHQPVVSFMLSFLGCVTSGIGGNDLLGMIKSGLMGWSTEDEDLLEIYIREFRIRSDKWRKEFAFRTDEWTDGDMDRLNAMRSHLIGTIDRAKEQIGRRNTAGEKVRGLYTFLKEDFRMLDRIAELTARQQELGLVEGASETAQIWNTICGIFDQIIRIIGDQRISNATLQALISSGLEAMEIGLVPVSPDCVLMGTLQRTRPGRIRALIVTGANDGVLPVDAPAEGLLSRREMEILDEMELDLARRDAVTAQEEQLSIYRMFSLPEEHLYVSCSSNNTAGEMLRPSYVFERLAGWCGDVGTDLEAGPLTDMVTCRRGTIPHLADALRRRSAGDPVDPGWQDVSDWYAEHDPAAMGRLIRGSGFSGRREALDEALADALYRGDREDLNVSASRLEKFSGCAFAHFIQYGLRAREERIFEVGGREIGDIYHRCLMEYSRSLTGPGDGDAMDLSRWYEIDENSCRNRIRQILRGGAENYRDGLFASDGYSEFRMERIADICGDAAWALTCQVRSGSIRRMWFEEGFGHGGTIPAVEVPLGGRKVCIRGVIDRLDMMDTGDGAQPALRVVDYKTGGNKIDEDEIRGGYQLQLMVYLDAARAAWKDAEPAGIFYFKIKDHIINGDEEKLPDPDDPSDLEAKIRKFYRMEGITINDPAILEANDAELSVDRSGKSNVINASYDRKNEVYKGTKATPLLEREEFRDLLDASVKQVEDICRRMISGEIQAAPHRGKQKNMENKQVTACTWCGFRSICMFDTAFRECRYVD